MATILRFFNDQLMKRYGDNVFFDIDTRDPIEGQMKDFFEKVKRQGQNFKKVNSGNPPVGGWWCKSLSWAGEETAEDTKFAQKVVDELNAIEWFWYNQAKWEKDYDSVPWL